MTSRKTKKRAHAALVRTIHFGTDEDIAAAVRVYPWNINSRGEGWTFLQGSIAYGRAAAIRALAARGDCDPNQNLKTGWTPLQMAVFRANGMLQTLLEFFSFPTAQAV